MGRSDVTSNEREEGRIDGRMRLSRALTRAGYRDVLTLSRESGREVLTEPRIAILDRLQEDNPPSVRALAADLNRDKGAVSRDLAVLAAHDIVEYETDGRAKAPRLKHETVVVEPLV